MYRSNATRIRHILCCKSLAASFICFFLLKATQLLSVMALGFTQALWALDAADGQASPPSSVVNVLVQALLGYVFPHLADFVFTDQCRSPNFDTFTRY